jgi:hypothetical protein
VNSKIKGFGIRNGKKDRHRVQAGQQHHVPGDGSSQAALTEPVQDQQGPQQGDVHQQQGHQHGGDGHQGGNRFDGVRKKWEEGKFIAPIALCRDL